VADTPPFGRLDGRRAFVSGGARGIGAAIAGSFVGAGANVVIADLDPASEVSRQIGAVVVRLDVSDAGAVQAAMAQHGATRLPRRASPAPVPRGSTPQDAAEQPAGAQRDGDRLGALFVPQKQVSFPAKAGNPVFQRR
jgi:hypothetical protein